MRCHAWCGGDQHGFEEDDERSRRVNGWALRLDSEALTSQAILHVESHFQRDEDHDTLGQYSWLLAPKRAMPYQIFRW